MRHRTMILAAVLAVSLTGCTEEHEQRAIEDVAQTYANLRADVDAAQVVAQEALQAARESGDDPETLEAVEAAQARVDELTARYEELVTRTDGLMADLQAGDYQSAGAEGGGLVGGLIAGPQGAALGTALGALIGGIWQRRSGSRRLANLAEAIDAGKEHNPTLAEAFEVSSVAINARLDPDTRRAVKRARR